MTTQRARAYARVMKTLKDLGPVKLLPSEQARTRLAADALLFCADLVNDASARSAYADIDALREHLISSGRWSAQRADDLLDDVWACGPGLSTPLAIAA
jgi:hypothetical protein